MKFLITGAAGFIGFHLSKRLISEGHLVVGIDTLNDYYNVQLKMDRLQILHGNEKFSFHAINIADKNALDRLFDVEKFDVVINLGAQAGVRHSIDKPFEYVDANLIGFVNVLEACRQNPVRHLIYASSSSVYGNSTKIPLHENDMANQPISLYAATKKANEMMAHSYASLYDIPASGLRFFTVYGPWGRPDMAYYKFTQSIQHDQPIQVYNNGDVYRDFTYVDDIIQGIVLLIDKPPKSDADPSSISTSSEGPHALYNIGNGTPVMILDMISTLEDLLGKKAKKEFLPMQPGDVKVTNASTDALSMATGYQPKTTLREGLGHFVDWFRMYTKA